MRAPSILTVLLSAGLLPLGQACDEPRQPRCESACAGDSSPASCGDMACSDGEHCSGCPADCGACPLEGGEPRTDGGSGPGPEGGGGGGGGGWTIAPKSLFPALPKAGGVEVTLVRGPTVKTGVDTLVAFGVPFPREVVANVSLLRVTDLAGQEVASHIEELARWRSLAGKAAPSSVRAALVYLKVNFKTAAPAKVLVRWGEAAKLQLGAQPGPKSTWVSIGQGPFPDEYPASAAITEPAVYATLPADWLGACLLRMRTGPLHASAGWKWFDDSFLGSSKTAVNDVPSQVTGLINYSTDAEAWLFDRAMTLFGIYARTGDVKWLRHGHRAAQFYAKHVDSTGNFDLKGDDLKYAYGQSLFIDLMLTGDTSLLAPIERVAANGAAWKPTYTTSTNFWTERHQTYALLAALSAWEATGKAAHQTRAQTVAQACFSMAKTPASPSWPLDGCLLHTMASHEGVSSTQPVCSPWMSALLADAIWRYYLHSEDPAALTFLAGLGDYVAKHALYDGSSEKLPYSLPWYLASSVHQFTDSGPWADIEHTCDVSGLVARAAWARKQLGGDPTSLLTTAQKLIAGCQYNLDYWHRPNGVASGLAEWRLTPPRKYNWWFGSTLDLEWLMNATP